MIRYEKNKLLSTLSSFHIGGPAKLFCDIRTLAEMQQLMRDGRSERIAFIGKGSNCLFDDAGFDGVVASVKIDYLKHSDQLIEVGAGFSFALLGFKTARAALSGLEFASGIPGSVGGAVAMNAGACGQETAKSLCWVDVVTREGERVRYMREELDFGYRRSPFQTSGEAVVAAAFALVPASGAREVQKALMGRRQATQPLRDLSAGCVFRNPEGSSAGQLIEQCGLKGSFIGGAMVSPIHANFIVNTGNATAREVLALKAEIKRVVQEETGVTLVDELRFIPRDGL